MPGTCAPATGLCDYPLPPCGSSTGDPHLRTFDGLFYDLQTAGDFLLVHTPDLTIQVRQTRYPQVGIAVNTSAVAQVGSDRVVFVGGSTRVWANGSETTCMAAPTPLAGGTLCSLQGRVILLHSARADVVVTVGGALLNVGVSLPPDVTDITGLLGRRDGDPHNDLMARSGEVLPLATTFTRFEATFADSWRVAPADSLFDRAAVFVSGSADGGQALVSAADLSVGVRAAAMATCIGAGVVDAALLQACALDVAVLGDAAAAVEVFGKMPAPRAVVYLTREVAGVAGAAVEDAPADARTGLAAGCDAGAAGGAAWAMGLGAALGLVVWARRRLKSLS